MCPIPRFFQCLLKKCIAENMDQPQFLSNEFISNKLKQYFNSVHQTDVFCAEICHEQALIEKYGFTQCCAKEGAEEEECFHAHKNGSEGAVPPIDPQPHEVLCKEFHDNKNYASVSLEYCHSPNLSTCNNNSFIFQEEMLKKHVAENLEVVKKNCDAHSKLGDYFFQNGLLTVYTMKAPQLEAEELLMYTRGFVRVANKCCNLDEGHKLKCAEENMGLVLGSICLQHNDYNINKQVGKCCTGPYDDLRECFGGLGVDPEYHAPAFNADLFHLDEGICTDAPEEAQRKKQTLLINMIKTKPDISEEQLVSAIVDFQGLVTNCCEADNHKACFDTETSKAASSAGLCRK
uniref:Albumin domain-containing protein n=1 Tax=Varanus komodoensis TaxID=61221 RepID=A0A8D2KU20_VARKO